MRDFNDGGPAFPGKATLNRGTGELMPYQFGTNDFEVPGMALRDFFAAKAMQGLLANPGGPIQANGMSGWGWCNCNAEDVADFAWHIADAMLKAREASNG